MPPQTSCGSLGFGAVYRGGIVKNKYRVGMGTLRRLPVSTREGNEDVLPGASNRGEEIRSTDRPSFAKMILAISDQFQPRIIRRIATQVLVTDTVIWGLVVANP